MKPIWSTVFILLLAFQVAAELQSVEVGGEVRIRGRFWNDNYSNAVNGPATPRYTGYNFANRPLGPFGLNSRFDFDDAGHDLAYVEHRTRVQVKADFTDDVSTVIEFESFDIWGTDFRSNYITGVDRAGGGAGSVSLYQSYIETRNTFGYPVRLRLGRQEMKLGKGWLVDDITTAIIGRSFDGARLTYANESFDVDGWAMKLSETLAGDEDADFYGVYGTYKGLEQVKLSAYWMLLRDGLEANDTTLNATGEWVESWFGHDDYEPSYLHTVGTRVFGAYGAFDYDWELAYQFGDADNVGALFAPVIYGDTDAKHDNFGTDLELGYTVDMAWQPRVFVGGALFEGEDNRDFRYRDWIVPGEGRSSVSFNTLFMGAPYSLNLGIGQELTNFWQLRAGIGAKPTEKISLLFRVAHFEIDETFDTPVWPAFAAWTRSNDDDLGWTTFLMAKYQYSADLSIALAWEHLFTGDGLEKGQFFARNGLEFVGGTDGEDADYVHFDVQVKF